MKENEFLRDTVRLLAEMVSQLAALMSEDQGEKILTETGECALIAMRAQTIVQMIDQGVGLP